jgi:hypothetical protein
VTSKGLEIKNGAVESPHKKKKKTFRIKLKEFGTHFSPFFKEKKPQIFKKCINDVYVKMNGASNYNKIIFYFCKSIENCLIRCRFF